MYLMGNMNNLFIVSAPPGSGKTSLMRSLLDLIEIVSVTTRPPRKNEFHGKDYYFLTYEEMGQLRAANKFVQYLEYDSYSYGVTMDELQNKLLVNHAYVIVSYTGMLQLKKLVEKCTTIFIDTVQEDCIQNMLDRMDSQEVVNRRVQVYKSERKFMRQYDYIIQNRGGNFARALHELRMIVDKETGFMDKKIL